MSTGEKTITADAARLRAAPRCGARTRAGTACRSPAVHGRSRCRMHGCGGGKLRRSGAPRGNRNAWKDGFWAAAARLRRRRMTAFIRDVEASLAELEAMNRPVLRPVLQPILRIRLSIDPLRVHGVVFRFFAPMPLRRHCRYLRCRRTGRGVGANRPGSVSGPAAGSGC